MAKIKFEKRDFEKFYNVDEKLLEKISMFGTPVEMYDDYLEIEIFPNRPDLISLHGFMRSFSAFLEKEKGMRKYKLNKPESDFKVRIDKSVSKVRPFTACAIVKDIKFDDEKIKEIIDLQEKLHATLGRNRRKVAIGIYPLEKITLPITYEARKPQDIKFIPLESEKEMNGLQILKENPKGKEYAHLLEGQSLFPVFVDSKGKILSMPPIINSDETGKVDESTRSVFIECSGFNFETLNKALNIVITTFSDMGGEVYQMELDYSKKEITPNLEPEKMKVSAENASKLLGIDLKEKDLEKLLPKMGYEYKNKQVMIPAWRTDILHEVDVIEDIAIAYGYDRLIPEIPKVATIGQESEKSKIKSKISEIISGLEFQELSSYHLVKPEELKLVKDNKAIELENSRTEYKFLRNNLMIPSLRAIIENKDKGYPQKIFELGKVFRMEKNEVIESEHLIISCIPSNFTEMKQTLDYVMKMLALEYEIRDSKHPDLIEGRTGAIILDGKTIGHIGEVHPQILENWNIKQPFALIEISLDEIFEMLKN